MLLFCISIHQRILEKENHSFNKNVSTTFMIDNNNNVFLEQQISILEWFLKDHMTLKIDAENSALHHRNKLHFKIY